MFLPFLSTILQQFQIHIRRVEPNSWYFCTGVYAMKKLADGATTSMQNLIWPSTSVYANNWTVQWPADTAVPREHRTDNGKRFDDSLPEHGFKRPTKEKRDDTRFDACHVNDYARASTVFSESRSPTASTHDVSRFWPLVLPCMGLLGPRNTVASIISS